MAYAEMIFSKAKQLAALGYAIGSDSGYDLVSRYVMEPSWFSESIPAGKVYKLVQEFHAAHHRIPSIEELQGMKQWTQEDPRVTDRMNADLKAGLAALDRVALDVLVQDLSEFRKSWLVRTAGESMIQKYNASNLEEVQSIALGLADQLRECDPSQHTYTMDQGIDAGLAAKDQMAAKLLTTGLSFFDEPMGGLCPDDLLVIASPTGQGKTALMSMLARSFAMQKKRVKFFALEAGDHEIEMRLMYREMMDQRARGRLYTPIDYGSWKRGLHPETKPFEDPRALKEILKYVAITYKKNSRYGVEEIERDISNIRGNIDVVLIDHLHYIDRAKGMTETESLEFIMKRLRDLNLRLGIPIILAAHVKKQQEAKRYHTLLPSMDDIYGSGSVSKVATWVIAQSQTAHIEEEKFPSTELRKLKMGNATLVRFLKSRDYGASRTSYTIVPFFLFGGYGERYVLGKSSKADTVWTETNEHPEWAKGQIVWKRGAPPVPPKPAPTSVPGPGIKSA